MKYAKSMYLGGEIITAESCDYASFKQLGLICPICHEAVFLVQGSERKTRLRNNKEMVQQLTPHFNHYKDNQVTQLCNNRVISKFIKIQVAKQRTEVRNQRLVVYNQHLWDFIRTERNLKPKKLSRLMGNSFKKIDLQKSTELIRQSWIKFYASNESQQVITHVGNGYFHDASSKEGLFKYHRDVSQQRKYFEKQSLQKFHDLIVNEIFEFLTTNTAKHIWVWLTRMVFYFQWQMIQDTEQLIKELEKNPEKVANMMASPEVILSILTTVLYGCRWLELINLDQSKRIEKK